MPIAEILDKAKRESWSDAEIVNRVCEGETALYEILVRRYNQRLYRVARAILRDDSETEDIMQDAFVRAFQNLRQFKGLSPFCTWLTRIAVHEALARLRFRRRMQQFDENGEDGDFELAEIKDSPDPEQESSKLETRRLLEEALLALPTQYRTVLMLRHVEDLSTAETAEALGLTEENVKVRLHRGRSLLRRHLLERFGAGAKEVFPFMGTRCDRVTSEVLLRISQP
jgi:RNA polymerase sigma-70 factor, ECF subfamily